MPEYWSATARRLFLECEAFFQHPPSSQKIRYNYHLCGCSSVGLEYLATNQGVVGSIPASRTIKSKNPAQFWAGFFYVRRKRKSLPEAGQWVGSRWCLNFRVWLIEPLKSLAQRHQAQQV